MNIGITRIDSTLPLPEYHTKGAVAVDLVARESTTIEPRTIGFIPNNIILKIPEGYMFMIAARSSTAHKRGLFIANGVGIIDQDYCGPQDEIKTAVYNFTETPVTIERGERVSQGIFIPITKVNFTEEDLTHHTSRGGFGSTGI